MVDLGHGTARGDSAGAKTAALHRLPVFLRLRWGAQWQGTEKTERVESGGTEIETWSCFDSTNDGGLLVSKNTRLF